MEQDTSISKMNALCEELKLLKEKKEQAEKILEEISKEFEAKKLDILEILQTNSLTSFPSNAGITVGIRNEFYVKQPMGADNEKAFNDYLEKEGLSNLRKVNYQTLNSFYRERLEIAAEKGEMVVIPGLETPSTKTTLTIRKGK